MSHSQGFKGHMGQANHRVAQLCPVSSFSATGFFVFVFSPSISGKRQQAAASGVSKGSRKQAEVVVRIWESTPACTCCRCHGKLRVKRGGLAAALNPHPIASCGANC